MRRTIPKTSANTKVGTKKGSKNFNSDFWTREIERVYTDAASGVIALQNKLGWYEKNDFHIVHDTWNEVLNIISEAPNENEFIEMLERAGMNFDEFIEMYGEKKIEDAILYAKDLKDRYTVLWLNYLYF